MKEVTIYAPIRILILVDDNGVSPRLKEQRDALGQGINRRGKRLDRLLEIVLSRIVYGDQQVTFLFLHPHDLKGQATSRLSSQ